MEVDEKEWRGIEKMDVLEVDEERWKGQMVRKTECRGREMEQGIRNDLR